MLLAIILSEATKTLHSKVESVQPHTVRKFVELEAIKAVRSELNLIIRTIGKSISQFYHITKADKQKLQVERYDVIYTDKL